jgi:hypothetical protein
MATSGQNPFAESTEHPSSYRKEARRQRDAFVAILAALVETELAPANVEEQS